MGREYVTHYTSICNKVRNPYFIIYFLPFLFRIGAADDSRAGIQSHHIGRHFG